MLQRLHAAISVQAYYKPSVPVYKACNLSPASEINRRLLVYYFKMKLSSILILPTLAIATLVYPSTGGNCNNNVGTISACGCTGMSRNYNILSARVDFQKATARFYTKDNCVEPHISVASDKCFNNANWPYIKSVRICGGTCGAC